MVKTLIFIIAIYSGLFAQNNIIPEGTDLLAIKSLMLREPSELDPNMSLLVGSMYQHGMKDMGVSQNRPRALEYYKHAAKNKIVMANLIIANMSLEDNSIPSYIKNLWIVVRAKNSELSIPSGLQLSSYFIAHNKRKESIEVLQFLADEYNEPRAQFLIGWATIYENFTSQRLSKKDGRFYMYQACKNLNRTQKIETYCKKAGINK